MSIGTVLLPPSPVLNQFDLECDPYTDMGEIIDEGNDFTVRKLGKDYVAKCPNRARSRNLPYDNMSPDFYDTLVSDDAALREILGGNLAKTMFFPPTEINNYRLVQQKFGEDEFLSSKPEADLIPLILANKEKMAALVVMLEAVEKKFGVPFDLTPNNIVFHHGEFIITENVQEI